MEFKEFCKERDRMCQYHSGKCKENICPLFNVKNNNRLHRCDYGIFLEPEEAEIAVSEWSKEHPFVTNRKKFKEVFGFNIIIEPEKEGDFVMNKEVLLERVEKWLQREYKPPRKENADD